MKGNFRYPLVLILLSVLVVSAGTTFAATKMVFMSAFDAVTIDRLRPVFDEFANANNVEWEFVSSAWDQIVEKTAVMTIAGVPPDVLRLGSDYAPLAAAGLFEDLNPYIKRDKVDVGRFQQEAFRSFTWRGTQVGLPTATAVYGVYYNLDLFDRAGVAYPPSDWKAPGWTYDDMAAAAARLARDDNADGRAEIYGSQWGFRDWWLWAWASGKDFANADGTRAMFDDPDIIRAIDHAVHLTRTTPFFSGGNFMEGTAAMWLDASWSLQNLAKVPFRVNFAVLPRMEGRHSILYPNNLMMFRDSRHKELAWQFVKFATYNPRGAMGWASAVMRIPALREIYTPYMKLQEQLHPQGNNWLWIEALDYAKPNRLRYSPKYNIVEKLVNEEMKKVTGGQAPAAAILPQLNQQVNALLQEK